MDVASPSRTDWTDIAARFFAVMVGLATVYALANAPAPEALLLPLVVVLPIAWITLRDSGYERRVWAVAVWVPVVVWVARLLIG